MKEYHKIQSIFKRDDKTHKFLDGIWALPEFEYLKNNQWEFTEKIDGTNIRVGWDGENITYGGRTDNAQIPTFLLTRLQELFTPEKLRIAIGAEPIDTMLCGEGFGAKIQKGGGNYIPNGVDFILFDVLISGWWLRRNDVRGIAESLGIRLVPIVGYGSIGEAIEIVRSGYNSSFGDFNAEGLVLRPTTELFTRHGQRIITKLKTKDF